MRKSTKKTTLIRAICTLMFLLTYTTDASAQLLKKLGRVAGKAAERVLENRVDEETSKKTDQVLDSILEPGTTNKQQKQLPIPQDPPNTPTGNDPQNSDTNTVKGSTITSNQPKTLSLYSKFDFVPGDTSIFVDDFSNDFMGDFPSRWNTNGSGELVTVNDEPNKWLKILPGYNTAYIPDATNLPENFTLEFDVIAIGLDGNTSSQSFLSIEISDNNTFNKAINSGQIAYSFCQFIASGIIVENNIASERIIYNTVNADIRNVINKKHHVSIAVNKERLRFWINENKYIDVPRLLPSNVQIQGIKFGLRGINTEKEAILISNIKIAKADVDLRKKLLADGKISTNGILFDSGSANIQPQSMGIIRQIYQVLEQDKSLQLKIVGHTDADGNDAANLELSKKRAMAVKETLVTIYNVAAERLTTDGKGATVPLGDNATENGKAQNRRVEFIKQ